MEAYDEPKSNLDIFDITKMESCDVIYPSCDSEFILDLSLQEKILENMNHSTIISISTKSKITHKVLRNLIKIDKRLKEKSGYLKVSVSISTKYKIDEIEPNTSSYSDRIKALSIISSNNIACSVNIKPIIPSIPLSEYIEIIDDCSMYSDNYLLGGLYIDESTIHKELSHNPTLINPYYRTVDWLPNKPKWLYLEDEIKVDEIKAYIEKIGKNWHESDVDFLKSISDRIE